MSLQEKIEQMLQDELKKKQNGNAKDIAILKLLKADFARRPNLNILMTDFEVCKVIESTIKGEEELLTYLDDEEKIQESKYTINFLKQFLPKKFTYEELQVKVKEVLACKEIPAMPARMKLMSVLMKEFGTSADGNLVKKVLMEL